MLLVEIMTIIYCLGEKNAEYVDYRNSLQKEYIETYDIFINGIDERAQTLLSSLGNDNDVYYKRNVDKMVSDYERLSGVQIDQIYNWGVEKYADYTYGIFFCMLVRLRLCCNIYEKRFVIFFHGYYALKIYMLMNFIS